jgi:hypothetical protein
LLDLRSICVPACWRGGLGWVGDDCGGRHDANLIGRSKSGEGRFGEKTNLKDNTCIPGPPIT